MKSIILLFCFIGTFSGILSFEFDPKPPSNVQFANIINSFSRANFPKILEAISAEALSERCSQSTNSLGQKALNPMADITDGYWSLKMLDATGKIPEGLLTGNLNSFGSYQSCLDIKVLPHQHNGTEVQEFQGRYVPIILVPGATTGQNETEKITKPHQAATWRIPPLTHQENQLREGSQLPPNSFLRIGLCVPSTCSQDEVVAGVQSYLDTHPVIPGVGFLVANFTSSSYADEWVLDGLDIFMVVLVSLIVICIIVGTCIEAWILYNPKTAKVNNKFVQLMVGCSAYKNTRLLFTVSEKNGKSEHLYCLNGIRFISMTWVLMGHVCGNVTLEPAYNLAPYGLKLMQSYAFQAVTNAFPSVDTFFLLSGCLVTYLTLKELDKTNGRINWIMFYVHRYLRLTGVYAFVILFHMTLLRLFAGGPSDLLTNTITNCRLSWWRHLLYVTNYDFKSENFDSKITCIGQTWYLDNDMQMFLVTPLIIYPIWRLGKWGLMMAAVWVVGSVIIPLALTIQHDWPASFAVDFTGNPEFMAENYIVPWCRFSPYICGILLGYILHVTKQKPFKMPHELNVFLWIVFSIVGYLVIYGLNIPQVIAGTPISSTAAAIYGGFHRLAWAMAVGWVIFSCCRGYGGWINAFLSWEAFEPLAKLSYNIFLVHMTMMWYFFGKATHTVSISDLYLINKILTCLVFSTFVSAILFICVEAPWANTEKWIFSILLGTGPKALKENIIGLFASPSSKKLS